MTGTARVIRADSRNLPLADDSVDLVVTSPPYFALRSYTDGGVHYDKQIGAEATPDEFVTALLEVTAECVRVLKPSGSLWVNLGDKYVADNRGSGIDVKRGQAKHAPRGPAGYVGEGIIARKSLMGIPWRYALRCIDDLGLILRAEVIWSKPNGLPESVTDRVRRSHEQWFHFTLSPRYFSAVDEIREAQLRTGGTAPEGRHQAASGNGVMHRSYQPNAYFNPLGKLPGSVWTVPTEPLRVPEHLGVDHFAAFPTEWPRRIIAGWSPAGVCTACGEGRRPVVEKVLNVRNRNVAPVKYGTGKDATAIDPRGDSASNWSASVASQGSTETTITGYACACTPSCSECNWTDDACLSLRADTGERCCTTCNHATADTTPAVILDPFGGTGTTALVAKALGRHGITVDMSADYCRLAEWRVNDPDQLAKAARVDKPPKQLDGQLDLLGDTA